VRLRATAALALALATVAGGCGSDDEGQPIPPRFAAALENRLDRIADAVSDGSPAGCQSALDLDPQVHQIVDTLPGDVDAQVRDALARSFDRLFELVAQDCNERDQTETETTPTETETTPTETETLPTETVPPATETETTPTTTPTTPEVPTTPDDGAGNGGGAEVPGAGQ
jgi:hypothetical protein